MLSRAPLCPEENTSLGDVEGVIAALEEEETDLPTLQWQDEDLAVILTYLETGLLPSDEYLAKRVALTESQYTVEKRILY